MTWKKIYRFIHKLGRTCMNCDSWRVSESLLCPSCENHLLSQEKSKLEEILIQNRKLKCFSLFDWIPDQNRCLSLLVKNLKNGNLLESSRFWGEKIALQRLQNFTHRKDIVLVPAPAKMKGQQDHAWQLAKGISDFTGWPILETLEREQTVETKALSRSSRARLSMKNHEKITSKTCVIFVDDVVTTGSTAMAAHRALGLNVSFEIWCLAKRGTEG